MTSLPKFSVDNPVLVGLFSLTLIIGGVYSGLTLVREMFPESTPFAVSITTVYPGATPAEVEKGIAVRIEEAIKDIDEIEDITTEIGEGYCTISAKMYSDVNDVDQVVNDVKAAIDTIPRDDFPDDAEETQVSKFEPKLPVINVTFYGRLDQRTIQGMSDRLRDDLLLIPGITDVFLRGKLPEEISVEIPAEHLIEYGLSIPDIAVTIANANLDLPGGEIKTRGANVSIRTLGERDEAIGIGEIILRSDLTGKTLRLNEIAEVIDGYEDADVISRFQAMSAVTATVLKTPTQDAIGISKKVQAFVAGKTRQPLQRDWAARAKLMLGIHDEIEQVYEHAYNDPYPAIGNLKTSTNLARFIEGRLDLLKRNGLWGLVFVFLSLLAFLNWRVAFWVMFGLLLSIFGTVIVMRIFGYSLNLVSMLGLIVVLGLLVDDAIVVGEHIYTRVEDGEEPRLAAVRGAEDVTWPVVCAIATTIVAFLPLLFIDGQMGDFMSVLPVIATVALSVSLLEALTVLPSHLATGLKPNAHRATYDSIAKREPEPDAEALLTRTTIQPPHEAKRLARGVADHVRRVQAYVLQRMLLQNYERLLRKAVRYRYVTMATLTAVLILAVGLVLGGRVPLVLIQKMDSETLIAGIELPVGTPIDKTDAAVSIMEQAAFDLPELNSLFTVLGEQYGIEGGKSAKGSHVGQLIIELEPADERNRTSEEILRELRAVGATIPGINALKFGSIQGGPGGAAIQIEISGREVDQLADITKIVKEQLSRFKGVYDVDDDFDAGRREVKIELLESGRALGLTTQSLATQVRGAFFGLEARKLQRGREDVKIMVRFPESQRKSISDIESMWIATPNNIMVPFTEVASLTEGRAYAAIRRKNQKRTITITADVDQAVGNADEISTALAEGFPALIKNNPGLRIEFGGQGKEFKKSISSLKRDFLIASLLIYVILAGLFKSYVQPLIVMTAIPFGFIGAVGGHYVMGYPLTILSMIGLVALTGIVVNDSLILVDFINHRRAESVPVFDAIVQGGKSRLRAIILTSLTTVLGLAPLLFETSFQAQFLIPMGISIAGGLIFATVLTLVAIPCLYMILEDAKTMLRNMASWFLPAPKQA